MSHSRALPAAYRLDSREQRESYVPRQPRCVFFEVTNRCNLACATCVRAFTSFEAVHDLTMDEFVVMVEQFPEMERAVLHGLGEPLLTSRRVESMCCSIPTALC